MPNDEGDNDKELVSQAALSILEERGRAVSLLDGPSHGEDGQPRLSWEGTGI